MVQTLFLFAVGLLLLVEGGDFFVDGATGIAHRFHVPELLIGATIVSIGTTLPEVMVSAESALTGHSEIAYGNAIGSVICNTALIAAITITAAPGRVSRKTLFTPVAFFFGAAAFYLYIAYGSGMFSRSIGLILLGIFAVYIAVSILEGRSGSADPGEEEPTKEEQKLGRDILRLVLGAASVAIGANLLVNNGTLIAEALGVPESVIALTMVALGTSLPELATAVTSLIRGHSSLSLGNIIGANLFNLVLVNGAACTLAPYSIPCSSYIMGISSTLVVDLPVMLGVMLLMTLPALITGKLHRWQGVLLLLIYAAFCVYQFVVV